MTQETLTPSQHREHRRPTAKQMIVERWIVGLAIIITIGHNWKIGETNFHKTVQDNAMIILMITVLLVYFPLG